MPPKTKGLIELHAAVLLFSFSPLFPKILALPVMVIVSMRLIISAVVLRLMLHLSGQKLRIESQQKLGTLLLLGFLFAVNLFSFYQSVRVSTVAISVLTTGIFPVLVAILEPWYFKEKIRWADLILALIAFTGVLLIIPAFDVHHKIFQGVFWGLLAALSYALYCIMNRKQLRDHSSLFLTFYQHSFAGIILLPSLFLLPFTFHWRDLLWMLLLGTVLTAGSQNLFVKGMTYVKARTAGMILMLEPIYGILFALLFIDEIPAPRTLFGGAIILAATLYATLSSAHQEIIPVPE